MLENTTALFVRETMMNARHETRNDKRLDIACRRHGVTAVEFAITLPILFLFLFGVFELGRGNMMRNTTEAAAYEAARVAIIPGTTVSEAEQAARYILATSGIEIADFDIVPSDLSIDTESVLVTVTVSYEDNSVLSGNFLSGANISRSCVLNRERNR